MLGEWTDNNDHTNTPAQLMEWFLVEKSPFVPVITEIGVCYSSTLLRSQRIDRLPGVAASAATAMPDVVIGARCRECRTTVRLFDEEIDQTDDAA